MAQKIHHSDAKTHRLPIERSVSVSNSSPSVAKLPVHYYKRNHANRLSVKFTLKFCSHLYRSKIGSKPIYSEKPPNMQTLTHILQRYSRDCEQCEKDAWTQPPFPWALHTLCIIRSALLLAFAVKGRNAVRGGRTCSLCVTSHHHCHLQEINTVNCRLLGQQQL